ncbi:branched-chain amino acid ABC transporter permease [Burkholderia sp. AU30198]|uniref:branched-chain amino acid ABC transporter permease n=1 Tax=Burkholderia sp. AU30198 TaxID=2879627 RepID=UPI001CF0E74D|nr:branched-chain amino acid ABC transporter permease [Burkholderia sp. AU30198]MCA8294732.1 branched-chain amino acid ABC transporter permease [Burkholderia sp. AU30198]
MLQIYHPNLSVILSGIASGFLLGGMLALTALGLSIALGVMRLVNLAHGELLVGGAYIGFFLVQFAGIDPLLGLPLVAAIMGAIALPFHKVLVRPLANKGMEAPMMTMFGVSIILQNLYLLCFSADTRAINTDYAARPLVFGPVTIGEIYVIGFVVSVALTLGVHALITRTRFGRDLRAAAVDPSAAAVIGVDVAKVHALTFALGAACAAMGGVLIATAFSFTPSTGSTYLLMSFAVVVMGGIGNIFGTLAAGITLGILQSIGALAFGDGYRDLVGLVIFLFVLALRPQGMVPGVR